MYGNTYIIKQYIILTGTSIYIHIFLPIILQDGESAATPGNTFPSSNSKLAPPPVLT